ncbi:DUF4263 domain-containing protein [Rubrobacter tropicus]|uniref:DUF4263 domain-containing protein n=1 Tax=Rubrobacter tropicus TaxID=2653851 RepID=A0A6G8Q8H6_9ACTN|nr:Shedu anti-phage system protein SduA domain-containing protein [Rubrobacter tropicus]QIN82753.1 DUF4263 domain-containing protein [Rubrobacter tropicus]
MGISRREKWKEPKKSPAFLVYGADEEVKAIFERRRMERGPSEESEALTQSSFIEPAKELIFDKENDRPVFHPVLPMFNTETAELELSAALTISLGEDDSEELREWVKLVLALAVIHDVPVYPDTEELASELASYHEEMLVVGFRTQDESGKDVFVRFNKLAGTSVGTLDHLEAIRATELQSPAEIQLIKRALLTELQKREEAGRLLASLRLAIAELEGLLDETVRNENALQRCLTQNPILFGTDYRRVIPKHRLGDEYEMDYALERVSGLFDLVEIEASTHLLFTQSGDPRKELVHAEQQVLDWIDWVERNGGYAQDRLPGLIRPFGYVIIGRTPNLDEGDRDRLRRRNSIFRGAFQILTYDDLLDRAGTLLKMLEGRLFDPGSTKTN